MQVDLGHSVNSRLFQYVRPYGCGLWLDGQFASLGDLVCGDTLFISPCKPPLVRKLWLCPLAARLLGARVVGLTIGPG